MRPRADLADRAKYEVESGIDISLQDSLFIFGAITAPAFSNGVFSTLFGN